VAALLFRRRVPQDDRVAADTAEAPVAVH